jgi:hypothetical protein
LRNKWMRSSAGIPGSTSRYARNTKCGSGSVPVRDDFAVNGRHGRQFWAHAQSGPNGLLLVRQARHQPLIGNNPDLPGCGAVFPGSGPGWLPAFQVAMCRPRSEISPRS